MWRNHLIIVAILIALILPIYFLDQHFLKPVHGGWISLDLRGLFIGSYLVFLALHLGLSSLGIYLYPKANLGTTHLISAIGSIVVTGLVFYTYHFMDDYKTRQKQASQIEERQTLKNVIELKEWNFVPNAQDPKEVHAQIKVSKSGRFSGHIDIRENEKDGKQIFADPNLNQLQVKAGDEFPYIFKLQRYHPGQGSQVEMTFSLFKNETGSALEDITKIFISSPQKEDDGNYFYGELPKPL